MVDWWDENGPPVYIAVASYLGLIKTKTKGSSKSGSSSQAPGDLNDLLKLAGPGGMIN